MDIEGLKELVAKIESGAVDVVVRDTTEPSVLAHEILNGRPFTYLDDAPLEERRSRQVTLRRGLPVEARDLASLDPAAIERVREQVRPEVRDADELHDLLMTVLGHRPEAEWQALFGDPGGGRAGGHAARARRRPVVRGRAQAPAGGAVPRSHGDARSPFPGRGRGARPRRGGRADAARSPGVPGPVHRGRPVACDRAGRVRRAARAGPAGDRGLRAAGALHRPGQLGRVLRPAGAGPHPRLHPGAQAPRDRAGHRPGLHAVPAALAARHAGQQARGPLRRGPRDRAAAGIRAGRGRLGIDPGRPDRGLPHRVAG